MCIVKSWAIRIEQTNDDYIFYITRQSNLCWKGIQKKTSIKNFQRSPNKPSLFNNFLIIFYGFNAELATLPGPCSILNPTCLSFQGWSRVFHFFFPKAKLCHQKNIAQRAFKFMPLIKRPSGAKNNCVMITSDQGTRKKFPNLKF